METQLIDIENLPQMLRHDAMKKQIKTVSTISKKIVTTVNIENNSILKFASHLPIIRQALQFEKGFTAIIPEDLKKGIGDGIYKIMQSKDGSIISTIVDSKTGKIVHQMRLQEFTKMVNPAALSQAMNNMCMQMQLEEIQQTLMGFRVETNAKLDEILLKLKGNRVNIPTNQVKEHFKEYQNGEITKDVLMSKIIDAKVSVLQEIADSITVLRQGNCTSINQTKNAEIQTKIGVVLESIDCLKKVYMIEILLNKTNKKKCVEITKNYTMSLLKVLSKENIQLLDSYSDFDYLGLTENIWETKLLPMAERLLEQNNSLSKYQITKAAR